MNNAQTALAISHLHKTYKGGFVALKDVSLTIKEGDFFALLGPNGAGKSTIIGIITSLVNKTAGKVSVFDIDIDEDFSKAKNYVGVVPQEFNFNIFETVEQIIINQAGYYGLTHHQVKDRLEYLLNTLALIDKRHAKSRELSGGMKRRLMIARALIHSPKLLILDEPTAGVDIELRRSMWKFITDINKNEQTTIILTTHYLEEAEQLAKNIAIIDKGTILVNTNIKDFLKTSGSITYVIELAQDIVEDFSLNKYTVHRIDNNTIEVEIDKQDNVTSIIKALESKNLHVHAIKPKENRLESLFINMVEKNKNLENKKE